MPNRGLTFYKGFFRERSSKNATKSLLSVMKIRRGRCLFQMQLFFKFCNPLKKCNTSSESFSSFSFVSFDISSISRISHYSDTNGYRPLDDETFPTRIFRACDLAYCRHDDLKLQKIPKCRRYDGISDSDDNANHARHSDHVCYRIPDL